VLVCGARFSAEEELDTMEGFGPHLMLDGYGCEQGKLEDLEHIYQILDDLPGQIGMTKIMPPYVFKYTGVRPENWGVSGFVLIAESHISIHTFPEKQYLSLDILSCKNFDVAQAIEYARKKFGISKIERNLLDRGVEFPKEIARATRLVRREREDVVPRAEVVTGTRARPSRADARR
jgi:S-adenosylmethionine decarboxylase